VLQSISTNSSTSNDSLALVEFITALSSGFFADYNYTTPGNLTYALNGTVAPDALSNNVTLPWQPYFTMADDGMITFVATLASTRGNSSDNYNSSYGYNTTNSTGYNWTNSYISAGETARDLIMHIWQQSYRFWDFAASQGLNCSDRIALTSFGNCAGSTALWTGDGTTYCPDFHPTFINGHAFPCGPPSPGPPPWSDSMCTLAFTLQVGLWVRMTRIGDLNFSTRGIVYFSMIFVTYLCIRHCRTNKLLRNAVLKHVLTRNAACGCSHGCRLISMFTACCIASNPS